VTDALNRFEHYEEKIDGLESQIESYETGKQSLSAEIDQLKDEAQVDDELAALKKSMAKKAQ
jgi:phage shock protein A